MTVGVLTCGHQTSVKTITAALMEKDLEAVVVLDDEGHAHGIVSRDNLVSAFGRGDLDSLTAQDIMQEGMPSIPPDLPLEVAAQLMHDQNTRIFFLTHHAGGIEYPAAYISYKHFLRDIQKVEEEEIKDLGIRAERKSPMDIFIERRDAQRKLNKNTHLE
jgi:predicted transcriptional regulator